MTYIAQLFVIIADAKFGEVRQVRRNRASAMCLADDWAEAGYENVRIVDPDGTEHDRCRFRETLTVVKQARQRGHSGLARSWLAWTDLTGVYGAMNATAAYFRDKAALCRRLADHLLNQDDPVVLTLRSMATEFDANADALETRVAKEAPPLSRDEKAPKLH